MRRGTILGLAMVLTGCESNSELQKLNDISSYSPITFENALYSYLSEVKMSDEVILSVINSFSNYHDQYEWRKRQGYAVDEYFIGVRSTLQNAIAKNPNMYRAYFDITLPKYDKELEVYSFDSALYWEMDNKRLPIPSGNNSPSYNRAMLTVDLQNWLVEASPEFSKEIESKLINGRTISAYITYETSSCDYYMKSNNLIDCNYKISQLKLFQSSPSIDEFTKPIAIAKRKPL